MIAIGTCIRLLWGDDWKCRLYLVEENFRRVVILLRCDVYFNISDFGIYSL